MIAFAVHKERTKEMWDSMDENLMRPPLQKSKLRERLSRRNE
jgi:hypothetical protein